VSSDAKVSLPAKVEREDVRVMFARANEETPAAIQRAWAVFGRPSASRVGSSLKSGALGGSQRAERRPPSVGYETLGCVPCSRNVP
jgi:hypothetical protein